MNRERPSLSEPPVIEHSAPLRLIESPEVSVLLLAFNHAGYLRKAIEGVLIQRQDVSLELLIGEDCSSDESLRIALEYQRAHPEAVRVITAAVNVGVWRNYRRLLAARRGKYIAVLDGDDYWLPGKLRRQMNFLHAHPECAAVYTNALVVDDAGSSLGLFNDAGSRRVNLAGLLRRGNFLNTSSMVFRAAQCDALLEIDRLFIDYRIHLRLARFGQLAQLEEPLTVYRAQSKGSMVTRSNDMVRRLYWEAIMDVPRDCVSDEDLARGIADFMRRVIFRAVRTRRPQLVGDWMQVALAGSPFGKVRSVAMIGAAVLRAACVEIFGRLRGAVDPKYSRVLYRR